MKIKKTIPYIIVFIAISIIIFSLAIIRKEKGYKTFHKYSIQNYKLDEVIVKFKGKEMTNFILDNRKDLKSALEGLDEKLLNIFKRYNVIEVNHFFDVDNVLNKNTQNMAIVPPENMSKIRELTDGFFRMTIFKVPEDTNIEMIIRDLYQLDFVEYAEPNYIGQLDGANFPETLPDDSFIDGNGDNFWDFGSLNYIKWLYNCWGLKSIDADKAWQHSLGDDVIVAVIDTGVDFNHEDLSENMWKDPNGEVGYNFCLDGQPPIDTYGHGSHCAGIIGASGNNTKGIIGVAPNAKIMALRAGNEGHVLSQFCAEAIIYAVNNGAKIINNSWGIKDKSQSLEEAIEYAVLNNCILVFSAGNNNEDIKTIYSASHKDVICVGALDFTGTEKNNSSNIGKIDFLAPGTFILSTISQEHSPEYDNSIIGNFYMENTGTSMASPFVVGTIALLCSIRPDLSTEQARQILHKSCIDLYESGPDDMSGYGKLNTFKAIQFLQSHPEIPSIKMAINCNNCVLAGVDKEEVSGDCEVYVDISNYTYSLEDKDLVIEYGEGSNPQSWNMLTDSQTNCIFSGDRPDGVYTLIARLKDNSSNINGETQENYFEVRKRIKMHNTKLIEIYNYEVYGNHDIEIKGIVANTNYDSFKGCQLNIYDESGTELLYSLSPNINADNTFSEIVDFSPLSDGTYTIKLIVDCGAYKNTEEVKIVINSCIMDNWPQGIYCNASYSWRYQLTIVDGNHDGYKEIIAPLQVPIESPDDKSIIYDSKGKKLQDPFQYDSLSCNLPLIDVDSDNYPEIVYSSGVGLRYIDNLTDDKAFGEPPNDKGIQGFPVLVIDINNDGTEEVLTYFIEEVFYEFPGYIKVTNLYKLQIFNKNGILLNDFLLDKAEHLKDIRDLYVFDNGISEKRILIVSGDNCSCLNKLRIDAYNMNGSIDTLFKPVEISSDYTFNYYNIKFADINSDGLNEILIKTSLGIYVYDEKGNPIFQNKSSIKETAKFILGHGWCLADIEDDDNVPEIINISYDDETEKLFLEIISGKSNNWLVNSYFMDVSSSEYEVLFTNMIIGDCDEDYNNEIIMVIYNKDNNTSSICIADKNDEGYNFKDLMILKDEQVLDITINDLDTDNKNEIILISERTTTDEDYTSPNFFKLYVLKTSSVSTYVEWGLQRHDNNATSTYNLSPVFTPITNKEITEGDYLEFYVSAKDPEEDKLTYTVANLPKGANFNSGIGKFSWLTVLGSKGKYSLIFNTKDSAGLSDSITVNINIKPNNPPLVGRVIPSSGTFLTNKKVHFKTTCYDPDGWQNINTVGLIINESPIGTNCFYGCYNRHTNKLYLRNDANTSWLGGYAPGATNVIENTYAKLNCASTIVNGIYKTKTLTITWSIIFKSKFVGEKNIYLYVVDKAKAVQGWNKVGKIKIISEKL